MEGITRLWPFTRWLLLLHPYPPPTKTLSHSHLGWRHSARFQVLNMEGITRLWPFTRWLLCSTPPLPQPKTSHILTLVDVTPSSSKSSIWRASLGCDPSPDDCFAPPLPLPQPKTSPHSHLGWRHSVKFQVLNMEGITRLWPFTRWLLCSTPPLPQPKTSHILTLVDVTPPGSKSSIWRASLGCDPSPDDCFAPPRRLPVSSLSLTGTLSSSNRPDSGFFLNPFDCIFIPLSSAPVSTKVSSLASDPFSGRLFCCNCNFACSCSLSSSFSCVCSSEYRLCSNSKLDWRSLRKATKINRIHLSFCETTHPTLP